MRVWIVWSWYEVAFLASLLPSHIDVDCFIDRAWWPWTSKPVDEVMKRIQQGITHLIASWAEYIIVPPYAEHFIATTSDRILPVYVSYMHRIVFPASRVGKLWLLGVYGRQIWKKMKEVISHLAHTYKPTDYQRSTQCFDATFPFWCKDFSHWQVHLLYAKKRSRIMRNLIKDDLRYFKDCDVDTLVPLDWWLLYWEKMIRHRCGPRMRLHWLWTVRQVIIDLLGESTDEGNPSICRLRVTAYPEDILENKSWRQLFDRWGKRVVEINTI